MPLPTYIVMGASGSGKSSLINLMLGDELAATSGDEDCTKSVAVYSRMTVLGELRVIDTPGFGTGDTDVERNRLTAIRDAVPAFGAPRLIFVSRCDDTRLRPVEKEGLRTYMALATDAFLQTSWLALTFCASVEPQRLSAAVRAREGQIANYIRTLSTGFSGFEKTLLVDSVVRGWGRNGQHVLSVIGD